MFRKILNFICLFSAVMIQAQETLTLPRAVHLVLTRNPNILMARNNADIAGRQAQIGNAGLLPKFTLSAGTSYSEEESQTPPWDASTGNSAQLQATYTLFDGFGNIYRFQRLQAGRQLGLLDARNQIESIVLQLADGYYNAAAAFENRQIARELVRISQERLERVVNRSEYGRARTIDVLSAQVDLNADSVTLAQADLLLEQNLRSLNLLMFRDVHTPFAVDTAVVIGLKDSLTDILNRAMQSNAALEAARWREKQARSDYRAAIAAHMPRLDLSASYGYSQLNPGWDPAFDDPAKTVRAGATVTFNLFNGLQTHIERQNAHLTLENQEMLADQTELTLERDVVNAYQAFQTSLNVRDLALRSLSVAELNFIRTQELYQLGQVTSTQFREAQLNLIRAQSQLSSAKYDTKLNEMTLLRLTGELVGEDF
ncbi:TolC family protein [bacterium]|nr:TolC family protein [bacterium]